jgi:diguanylate cyclase (GGDEF)-like protein
MFGIGCAASLYTGADPLPLVSTASMMGLVAGVATRWAALPRLAIVSIILFSTPFLGTMIFMGDGAAAGAAQLAIVIAGTTMLTLQNQRTLITMLRAERQARELASTDSLTGLGNRSALEADLKILEESSCSGHDPAFAALFIDLDHFKRINDDHGHAAGDQVLREAAARLRTAAAPHPVYRVGGDEFLVIAPEQPAIAELLCDSIADLLCHPMQNPPLQSGIRASIGIAHGNVHEQSAEHIIARADHALYGIKRSRATEWRRAARDTSPAGQLSMLARNYPR